MNKYDGSRIVETSAERNLKIVKSTRWDEIRDCVNYHVQLSSLVNAPTIFRILNPVAGIPNQEFKIARQGYNPSEVLGARSILSSIGPEGVTPLTQHIHHIKYNIISPIIQHLNSNGQKVTIIIATDGLPTNSFGVCDTKSKDEFVHALKSLQELPVWIVIRLCTDEQKVVKFYSDIEKQLETSIEVLDDFVGEAKEIYTHNKWLNYGLPLHRCREFGFEHRIFDLIDERTLTMSEIRQFCMFLFGEEEFDGVPDPNVDFLGFVNDIDQIMMSTGQEQWNPITKKIQPWINIKKLESMFGHHKSICSECNVCNIS